MYINSGFNTPYFVFFNARQMGFESGGNSILHSGMLHCNHVRRHVFIHDFEYVLSTVLVCHQEIEVFPGQTSQAAFDTIIPGKAFRDSIEQFVVVHGYPFCGDSNRFPANARKIDRLICPPGQFPWSRHGWGQIPNFVQSAAI